VSRQTGLTLVEFMIVVGVLGLAAAFVLAMVYGPSSDFRERCEAAGGVPVRGTDNRPVCADVVKTDNQGR
jgi:prepilin-type N-terminal cleavage/methylation domain-containing protein